MFRLEYSYMDGEFLPYRSTLYATEAEANVALADLLFHDRGTVNLIEGCARYGRKPYEYRVSVAEAR